LYPFNIKQESSLDGLSLWLRKERITIYHSIPTLYRYFTGMLTGEEDFSSIRFIVLGGEAVNRRDVENYKNYFPDDCLFINGLGPTESTVTLQYFINKDSELAREAIPVGFPVHRTEVFLIDENNEEVHVYGIGEIVYKSDYLALGYLNRQEKASEVFVKDPLTGTGKGRIFRTGDLGRRLPDGNIEYIGRKDSQVKVRGYRVELGEIESQLDKIKGIKKSLVLCPQNRNQENYLAAYYVKDKQKEIDETEIIRILKQSLPGYMIPNVFMRMEAFPLTPSGKIDRHSLPEPDISQLFPEEKLVKPGNRIEEILLETWKEILKVERIGIDSDFFELGGHSLKAIILVSQIHKKLDVKLPLTEIFKTPTIRSLARYIKEAAKDKYVSIKSAEKKEYYALSSAQQRLYILKQMDLQGTGYNIPGVMILEGEVQKERFENTVRELTARHESLRTSFVMVEGEPVQVVHHEVEFEIQYLATEDTENTEGTRGLAPLYIDPAASTIKNFIRPFDLSQAPLLRVGLTKSLDNRYILMIDMHHIITDGTSLEIFAKEFMALYAGEDLPPLRLQYKDYSQWQNSTKERETIIRQEEYWLNRFREEIPVLNLPFDYPRPQIQDFTGSMVNFEIKGKEVGKLKDLAREEETTLYMVLLSIFNILLAKVSGQEDIVIGTAAAGRRHADLEPIIGMFVNTLALRNYPTADKTYRDFLKEVKNSTLDAFENQEYLFEDLVEQVSINRDASRNPLFDVMFILQNFGGMPGNIPAAEIPGLRLKPYEYESKISKFDMTLIGVEKEDSLSFKIQYSTKLFKKKTIERFVNYFKKIIFFVVEMPDSTISEAEIISEEEKKQIIVDFNASAVPYPKNKVIHELFEEQVDRNPDSTAVISPIIHITYNRLNRESNLLAGRLREKGVRPDTIVGIMVERSLEMILGILGILKARGAYLPIDTDYPEERKQYMLKDSDTRIVLTARQIADFSSPQEFKTCPKGASLFGIWNLEFGISPHQGDQLAYIIYTSGSTGKPKGVMVEHGSVVNLLFVLSAGYSFSQSDTYLLKTSYLFDVSVTELFGWFVRGGRLVIMEKEGEKDPQKILDVIERDKITHINFVPSMFNAFLGILNRENIRQLSGLKYIFLAGEVLLPGLVKKFKSLETKVELENLYGPTEAAVYASKYSLQDWPGGERVPIGKPLGNIRLYILNKNHRLQPVGVSGELCIAGPGAARGYLNRQELTAEKFDRIRQKFCGGQGGGFSKEPPCRRRLYRTGDLGRWLPDGNIEFLGRIDRQVKIRGFRIELEEIENQLLEHTRIKEAKVTAHEDKSGEKSLCAYVVKTGKFDETPNSIALQEYLTGKLPDYMIPSYFMVLDKIPLTPNGKVDIKALPKPTVQTGDGYTGPRDETEAKLVEIWSKILRTSIGIDDNFFRLGGHSLKAILMVSKIHKELNTKVLLTDVFKMPTIRGLAGFIKGLKEDRYSPMEASGVKKCYALSSAQKRLYILQQMEPDTTVYNISAAVWLEGDPDREKLEETFKKLINRHESLRTSFHMKESQPIQKIHEQVEFEIEYYSTTEGTRGLVPLSIDPAARSSQLAASTIKNFIKPFDLSQPPLVRVGLIHTPPLTGHSSLEGNCQDKHILMVDMHHIISDGISVGIFFKEFTALYAGENLPPLHKQYKDFSEWQNREKEKESVKRQEEYWLKEFTGEIPVLELPVDYPRPAVQDFEGSSQRFEIDAKETTELKALALQEGATLFIVMLAICNAWLSRLSGQEDIIVGTVTAGRKDEDFQSIIGMFVNTLALRNYPAPGKTFKEFLEEVKERTLAAFDNQDYPFEDLVDRLSCSRDLSRNPVFDVMFTLQDMKDPGPEIKTASIDLKVIPYKQESKTAKFDLGLNGVEVEQGLVFNVEYRTKLFKKTTLQRFIHYFQKIVSNVIRDPDQEILEIEIISEEEKNQVLFDFNRTAVEYPKNKLIHELFAGYVAATPDNIAVVGPLPIKYRSYMTYMTYISYRELNEKSLQLAQLLRVKGVGPGSIVGIKMQRSMDMIAAILGILKAGAAYLPIDPDYPQDRIKYMLKDSGAKILLSEGRHPDFPVSQLPSFPASLPSSLAYIIYTSGSTGKPKGVMIEHRNVVRLVKNSNYINLTRKDKLLMTGSIAFDITTFEIWGSLLNGLSLYLVDESFILDAEKLEKVIAGYKISILHLIPQLFNQLASQGLELFAPLKYLLVGGDLVHPRHINVLRNKYKHIKILHMYGPTENTTFSTFFPLDNDDCKSSIPLGKPISNSAVYILDQYNRLQPPGLMGELCVSGDGVARGYLNNPELTAEKFVELKLYMSHTSHTSHTSYMSYIYKTGDLGRWLPGGNIEFLGRMDQQVKIRGIRIEPGEIENQLLKHDDIKEAVVLDREEGPGGSPTGWGDKYLCAYIVPSSVDTAGLREYLSGVLPDYMVPSYFVPIEKIPLTPTGKLDRKALPGPEIRAAAGYAAPRNKIEKKLVEIWSQILGRDALHASQLRTSLGIDDNFFELGGHSLKAAIMAAKIRKEFNVNLSLKEIFKQPFIRGLSQCIEIGVKDKFTSIELAEEKEYYALSSAQQRLFILQQMEAVGTGYNMPAVMVLEGEVDKTKLEKTSQELIKRHESLRTLFEMKEEEPVQRVRLHRDIKFYIEYYDPAAGGQHPSSIIHHFVRPFDLSQAPLFRIGFIKIEETKHILMVDMHHIVSDGTSIRILVEDFMALYGGSTLPGLGIRYKDFSQWQKSAKRKKYPRKQEEYWLKLFEEEIPVLDLPTDFLRPEVQRFEGKHTRFEIGKEDTEALKTLALQEGATLYMVLLSIYNILLSKVSSQEDIIVGSPVSGRTHADLHQIIGMFVNTLPLRNKPESKKTCIEFLKEVRTRALEAFENQEYPFEDLVEKVSINRDASRNPLFDVMFALQNTETLELEIPGLKLKPYEFENRTSKFDLNLTAVETAKGLTFTWEYSTKLFKQETIERFIGYLNTIVSSVTANPGKKIQEIEIISEEEKHRVLYELNDTRAAYPKDKVIHQLFAEQVEQTPDNIAVIGMDHEPGAMEKHLEGTRGLAPLYITYRELNKKSSQLAHILIEKGVKPDTIVGIMIDRSPQAIIGILGILK
ncbi:MAG: amino acid adenylation domain-containing protein, partial [Candidatus Aminicenantes bacterium]